MQLVILAGGLATRLYPLTTHIPKSMIQIEGKPFLEYQIYLLKMNGIQDIILCAGNLKEQIKDYFRDGSKYGVSIAYGEERESLLGTGGALKNAEHLLNEEFLVMYGDSYLLFDFKEITEYFRKVDKSALMVVYKNFNMYDRSNVVVEDGFVKIYGKRVQTNNMVYIDAGLLVMKREVLRGIPANTNLSLEDILKNLIEQSQVAAFEVKQRFYEIGSKTGLEEFRQFIKSQKRGDK